MIAQHFPLQRAVGGGTLVALFAFDTDQELLSHAFDRFRVKAGVRQGKCQQIDSLVLVLGQGPQSAGETVGAGREAVIETQLGNALLEGAGIKLTRPFVEQAGRQRRHTFLAHGVGGGAAFKAEGQRDHWHGMILDQPDFDAGRARDALDLGGGGAVWQQRQHDQQGRRGD